MTTAPASASSPDLPDVDSSLPVPGPVGESERISALDTARGVALLGILLVNIQVFGGPFGEMIRRVPEKGLANEVPHYFVHIFCLGKFYTLFSTLFGIGLAIQWSRTVERGGSFTARGVRRMLFLLVLGLFHAIILWYGDILFLYALFGLIVLPMLKWTPRKQVKVGAWIMVIAALLTAAATVLTFTAPPQATDPSETVNVQSGEKRPPTNDQSVGPVAAAVDSGESSSGDEATKQTKSVQDSRSDWKDKGPFFQLMHGYKTGRIQGGPDHPYWMEKETQAFRDGPRLQSFLFNLMIWLIYMFITFLGFGWSIVAMFLFGAALYKSGVVTSRPTRSILRRFCFPGLLISIPLVALMAFLPRLQDKAWVLALAGLVGTPAAAAIALGYFGFIHSWVTSGKAAGLARLFANVGRFGLTNYLMQTIICTTVFYHWGFGLFGELSHLQLLGFALCLFAFQLLLSALLVKVLAYGPVEWLWRTFTYLKPQPFFRSRKA